VSALGSLWLLGAWRSSLARDPDVSPDPSGGRLVVDRAAMPDRCLTGFALPWFFHQRLP